MLSGLKERGGWVEDVWLGLTQDENGDFAVGEEVVAGGVGGFFRRVWAVDAGVGGGRSGVEEVCLDPLALAVDVGVDAMGPLGPLPRGGDGDVVGGGADPDLAALVGFGQLPDAEVVAFGEGVERFLEDHVGWAAIDHEERNGGLIVAGLADGRLDGLERGAGAEAVGFEPACLLEGGGDLLARAEEHEVGDVGERVVLGVGAEGRGGDDGLQFVIDGDEGPAGPDVAGLEHGGAHDLDLEVGASGEENLAADGEAIDRGDAFERVARDGIAGADEREGDADLGADVGLNDAEDLVVADGLAGVVYVDDAGIEGGTGAVGVDDVGEVEDEAGARVFVRSLLGEEDGGLNPGAGCEDEFAVGAGDVFAGLAEGVGDGAFDGVAGAGAVAVDGAVEANAEGLAGGEVGFAGVGDCDGDGARHLSVDLIEEGEEGDEEAAGGSVFDEESLDFEVGGVEEVVEGGVVVGVLAVDLDAALEEEVCDLLVGDDNFGFGVVAGAEDGPVEGGTTVLVGGLEVGAGLDELFGFGKAVEDGLLFGLAGGLIERLDERGGFGDVELDGRGGVVFGDFGGLGQILGVGYLRGYILRCGSGLAVLWGGRGYWVRLRLGGDGGRRRGEDETEGEDDRRCTQYTWHGC